jgi:hypothetical protein
MNTTAQTILNRSCPAKRANSVASLLSSRAFLTVMVSLAVLAMAGMANAALIAYEPFNYTAGSFANGTAATGTGFAGNWTCGVPGTVIPGLNPYSGTQDHAIHRWRCDQRSIRNRRLRACSVIKATAGCAMRRSAVMA